MIRLLILIALFATSASGATLQLKDGRTLRGDVTKVGGVAEDPLQPEKGAGEVPVTQIVMVDDGLRRTFVHTTQVANIIDADNEQEVKIRVWQNHAERGAALGAIGRMIRVTPFDQYGRRIYEMAAPGGSLAVVQGITEITPTYTRVRGLQGEPRSYLWDMRLATSSIPRETLSLVLAGAVSQSDVDARLQVVRLYLQSERYRDARAELEKVIADFPEMQDLGADVRQLRQLAAESILDEIKLRRGAGQFELARTLLANFPADEVAGVTLQEVRELLDALEASDRERAEMLAALKTTVSKIAEPSAKEVALAVEAEISAELNEASLPRMAAFKQLSSGPALDANQQLAVAISGWLLGADQAIDNLQTSLALYRLRDLVRQYLREQAAVNRAAMLTEIRDLEGSSVEKIAQLLKLMKPPFRLPPSKQRGPGCYELSAPGPEGEADIPYWVQLPPEYDPLRSYPTIVTLCGQGFSPTTQLDYWAGAPNPELGRRGQAMRHGYIVLAVDWQKPHQFAYNYSLAEHRAVLAALRDAQRRLAIDTDHIFLTGHDMGGDAAWDIGLAHPDLWAGVLPILAVADRYVGWYWENATNLPFYAVEGELDGGKLAKSAREFDRYLRPKFDATVVEYLGRGHESFSDEILRMFDWMGRRRRPPTPQEFEVSTLRPWDNFFWWIEAHQFPPKLQLDPRAWPPKRGTRAATVRGRRYEDNRLAANTAAAGLTLWLSPDVVNFEQPMEIQVNNRRVIGRSDNVEPDLGVLLEDARSRGDRKHPFWARVEWP